jgi:hypothetical protein
MNRRSFKQEALITKIMGVVYNDKTDPSVVRINTDGLIIVLEQAGYIFPRASLETLLEKELNAQLPKNLPADAAGKYLIANAIVALVDIINISAEDLLKMRIRTQNSLGSRSLVVDPDKEVQEELYVNLKTEREEQARKAQEQTQTESSKGV